MKLSAALSSARRIRMRRERGSKAVALAVLDRVLERPPLKGNALANTARPKHRRAPTRTN